MPWVKTVRPEDARGDLKEIYDRQMAETGNISETTEIVSLKHRYAVLWDQTARVEDWKLSRFQREMIAVVTSALCRCRY